MIDFIKYNIIKPFIECYYNAIAIFCRKSDSKHTAKIISHRGISGSNIYNENTLNAFNRAFELEADGIELDIRLTKDDVVVISHDDNLKRVFGIDRLISDCSFKQLAQLCEKVPKLEDILNAIQDKDFYIFIELKKQFSTEKDNILINNLFEILQKYKQNIKYYIISLDMELLRLAVQCFDSKIIIPIFETDKSSKLDLSMKYNLGGLFGYHAFYDRNLMARLNNLNLKTGCGIINSRRMINYTLRKNPSFIFTDDPAKLQ